MSKQFEIFRAGTHTDNNGRKVTITEADLAEAAAAYHPGLHEAPVVVGHPTTDAPAYGWVGGLKAEGGSLLADFAQMDEGFATLVRDGRYKKVSASFYTPDSPANPVPGKWSLRHVGFLGAHPPGVKGLRAIEFSEAEEGVVEFSEAAHGYAAMLFRNIREFIISKFGLDDADQVIPNWQIEGIAETAQSTAAFAEPLTPTHDNPKQEDDMSDNAHAAELAAAKAAQEKAEAEAAQAKAELKKLQDEQEKDLRDAAHKTNADFAEGLVKAGRLKPADKDLVVQALDFAEFPQHTTADFGEGEGKKPLAEALRDFLGAVLPKQLPGSDHLAKGSLVPDSGMTAEFAEAADPEALSHHKRAQALAAKEGISYAEAARRTVAG